ncbi:OLC1v1036172C1, partial [Oldenlandia corymbosa var. corymbosa]
QQTTTGVTPIDTMRVVAFDSVLVIRLIILVFNLRVSKNHHLYSVDFSYYPFLFELVGMVIHEMKKKSEHTEHQEYHQHHDRIIS